MNRKLEKEPVHLGLGACSVPLDDFDGSPDWYGRYMERFASDGNEARLVSMYTFEEPWDVWEMHPAGSELIVVTAGELTLVQEIDGEPVETALAAGEYAINPAGVWHTADVSEPTTAIFITAGVGTEHRQR